MSKVERFEVPREVSDQLAEQPLTDSIAAKPTERFSVPDHAARDLGGIAGQTSNAAELLQGDEPMEPETEPEDDEAAAFERERAERDAQLATRDFSFDGGETTHLFDELSSRKQNRVIAIRDKLLALYGDRGVTPQSIGLLYDTSLSRAHRRNGGGVTMGYSDDEYYLILLGKPLIEREVNGHKERETTSLRHRAHTYQVRDYRDLGAERPPIPRGMLLGVTTDEWLPIVQVIKGFAD